MLKILGTMLMVVLVISALAVLLMPIFNVQYIRGISEKDECSQVEPVLRDFVYYFNWIILIYMIFRMVMAGFLIHSLHSALQSGGGGFGKMESSAYSLIYIVLYACTIKYFYSIGNHPYCRLFESKTRNFLFVMNWICLILSATSLFGISL